jgi:hypothetical protein
MCAGTIHFAQHLISDRTGVVQDTVFRQHREVSETDVVPGEHPMLCVKVTLTHRGPHLLCLANKHEWRGGQVDVGLAQDPG